MNNKVSVVFLGEIYNLKSGENPAHMTRLATYVDGKMSELMSKSITASIDDKARTLILALNVADDYMKAHDRLARLDAVHKKFVQEMGRLQEENTSLKQKLNAALAELEAQKRIAEKISAEKQNTK